MEKYFWYFLLKGLPLLPGSFRKSSLNFELYLQSEINKSHINTTALFPTLFPSAAEPGRPAKKGEEKRVKPSHVGRSGASSGPLSPPRRTDRDPELPGAPRMAYWGRGPNVELQRLGDSGGSPPGQLIIVPAAGFQFGGPASKVRE